MKKIILIKTDTANGKNFYIPYSLLYLGTALKNAGFAVELIHCRDEETDLVSEKIKGFGDDVLFVGFSVITGPQIASSIVLSKFCHDLGLKVVWGGVHPFCMPRQCLEEDYIDYVVLGEGEFSIVELAKCLTSGQEPNTVLGLGYKKSGQAIFTPERKLMDKLDFRIDWSLIDISEYFMEFPEGQKRVVSYISSRGCPHSCKFCYNLNFNKRRWRPVDLDVVFADIDFLKKNYDIDGILFGDDNFFVDKERAVKILEYAGLPSNVEIRIDYITEELIRKISSLHVYNLLIGAESGNDRVLQLMDKRITVAMMKEAILLLAKYKLRTHYSFILGFPGESKSEIEDTLGLIMFIIDNHPNATFTIGQYLPYPGSPFYLDAIKLGFETPKETREWSKFDRWEKELKLPWVDAEFCYNVRWYAFFLATRIPFIQNWCIRKLRRRRFVHNLDLRFMIWLYHLAYHSDSLIGKLIKKLGSLLQTKVEH